MISAAIAVTFILIMLILRFKSTSIVTPQPAPVQPGQGGPQTPPATNTVVTTVSAKMGNWSYVAIVAIGLISGIVAYQFEKSGDEKNTLNTQKQTSLLPTSVSTETSAPAPNMVKTETPEVKSPAPAIPNRVVIYWGDEFEKRFVINVVCWDESSIRLAGGGRVFEGIKNSEDVYEGTWKRGSAHGHFSLELSPDGNLVASGTVKDGTGEHPLQIRKT